jgi:hypothetical protein
MPNCNFYATVDDHSGLLDWLFAEGTCEVHELSSRYEQPLRQFDSRAQVLALFDESPRCVHLQLRVLGASPPLEPQRVSLNPAHCDGATFRYAAEGWGLVQLYLGNAWRDTLQGSHTNHFTQKGAGKWEPVSPQDAGVEAWDFKRIASFSSRLNRQIRKRAAGKLGSQLVLPGALALWEQGKDFPPFRNGTLPLVRLDVDAGTR